MRLRYYCIFFVKYLIIVQIQKLNLVNVTANNIPTWWIQSDAKIELASRYKR